LWREPAGDTYSLAAIDMAPATSPTLDRVFVLRPTQSAMMTFPFCIRSFSETQAPRLSGAMAQ
jgi:hypothetical protein